MDGDVGEGKQRRASLQRATFTHIFTHRHSLAHPHKKLFSLAFTYSHQHELTKMLVEQLMISFYSVHNAFKWFDFFTLLVDKDFNFWD